MLEKYIIFGVGLYFFGLVLSGAVSFFGKSFKRGTRMFIMANLIGFLSVLGYFWNFSGETIILAQFDGFFQFAPRLNFLSALFFSVISGVSLLVGVYSLRYLQLYEKAYNPRTVQFLMAFFVVGMQGVLVANNSFVFLFFWETMSITSFFLVLSDRTKESVKAAFLYFIMTHLGASAILGAFLILGRGSILFSLSDIQSASQSLSPTLTGLACALFIFGFGSKAGLVPFHVWLPEAHPQAPSNISALMSGLMLKVAVYGFVMVILQFSYIPAWTGLVVLFLGLLSAVVGALNAVTKRDIKTALAYSSIENMGIIFSMLGLAMYLLTSGSYQVVAYSIIAFAILHAINHALFKTALFLSSGVIINRVHSRSLDSMGGIAKMMPVFAGAFLLATLGSLPLPPFGTFYGEWGLVQNIILLLHQSIANPGMLVLLLLILSVTGLVSGLAIFAMVKIFSLSMLGLPHSAQMEKGEEKTDSLLIVPIFGLGAGVLLTGIFASPIITILNKQLKNFSAASSDAPLAITNNFSLAAGGAIIIAAAAIYLGDRLFFRHTKKRFYQTWDCGQPIDATMQYSATAFAAPIRFFFTPFVGREISIKSEPLVATNPWIRKYVFKLYIKSVWTDALYSPIAKGIIFAAEKVRFVQNGRIQYYVLFLLLALIFTLIFAL